LVDSNPAAAFPEDGGEAGESVKLFLEKTMVVEQASRATDFFNFNCQDGTRVPLLRLRENWLARGTEMAR